MLKVKIILRAIAVAIISAHGSFGQKLLIKNVNVIQVENGEVLKNRDIHMEDGLIVTISKTKKRKMQGADVIDGSGKYVIPGFIDTHVHSAMGSAGVSIQNSQPVLKLTPLDDLPRITSELLIQHGITTARDPGGRTDLTVQARRNAAAGKGPEFLVAGSILDTTHFINLVVKVTNEDELRSEIRKQKEAGVNFIKLYTSLNPELMQAGIAESHKLGLKTIAHLHAATSWTEASNLGIDNIVHITPGHERYLPDAHRAAYRQVSMMGALGSYKWFEYVNLESDEIADLMKTLRSNRTSIDPTLVVFHATFFGNTAEYTENEMLHRLPEELVNNWKTAFNFNIGWTEQHFREAQQAWPKVQQFVKGLHQEGILLTAGTDANNPWIVPGDSFHKELLLLKNCGLSPAEVLKIATLNGAKLLGIDDRTGSLEKGKEADLILLNSNPLDDLGNTRDIHSVLSNGRIMK